MSHPRYGRRMRHHPSRHAPTLARLALALALPAAPAAAQLPGAAPPPPYDMRQPAIEVRYEALYDRTVVRVSIPQVGAGVDLSVSGAYPGSRRAPPDSVQLFVTRTNPKARLHSGDDIDIIVDGKHYLTLEDLTVRTTKMPRATVEQATVAVALRDLVAMSNAKAFGGKVGKFTFWVAGSQLDVLRDFATRLGVPTGPAPIPR